MLTGLKFLFTQACYYRGMANQEKTKSLKELEGEPVKPIEN
jgi:hypothetical protein